MILEKTLLASTPLTHAALPMWQVSEYNFDTVVDHLTHESVVFCDLETTGLNPYGGDKIIGVALADQEREWYFNFNHWRMEESPLPRQWLNKLYSIFQSPGLLVNHNLKFDGKFLLQQGFVLSRELYCTMALARVEYNEHLKYSLDSCGQRIGIPKDDRVKEYLDTHDGWEWESVPGKKARKKRYHFEQVPLAILGPYACQDVRVARALFNHQTRTFQELSTQSGIPDVKQVVHNERALTRVCLEIEHTGIRIDRTYCERALDFERARAATAREEFKRLAGHDLVDSAKSLGPALRACGIELGTTAKGADSVADDVLQPHKTNALVAQILAHRDAMKRANTYFTNFLRLADPQDRIHVDLRQSGTATGRFAAGDPNLQNLTAEDESPFPTRRAFITDPGRYLVSVDYAQMEYRLMFDYAQDEATIGLILGGLDVHEACAQLMGVPRSTAKNINFALLYGAGIGKLASMLNCTEDRARELKERYFQALRKVQGFIRTVIRTAENRGYIFNWMGRRCYFPDSNYAYKAPNYLIQGGAADIVKIAMVRLRELLAPHKTRMVLNVHDEILFLMPPGESSLIPEIVRTMVQAYPHKKLPMDCSVSWSDSSWHDLKDWVPGGP